MFCVFLTVKRFALYATGVYLINSLPLKMAAWWRHCTKSVGTILRELSDSNKSVSFPDNIYCVYLVLSIQILQLMTKNARKLCLHCDADRRFKKKKMLLCFDKWLLTTLICLSCQDMQCGDLYMDNVTVTESQSVLVGRLKDTAWYYCR